MRSGGFHFTTIQKLRAVAALAIVGVHLLVQLQRLGFAGEWFWGLTAGTDLFFVISGFIMWVTTAGKPVSPGTFLRKRLIRIVPLYWLLTALVLAVALLAPGLTQSTAPQWAHVVKSFLFIPAEHPVLRGEFMPVLPPGWTLELELPFYGLVALALFLPLKARLPALLATLSAASALHLVVPPGTALAFLTESNLLEFGFGLLIGYFVTSGTSLPAWAGPALMGLGLAATFVFFQWMPVKAPLALVPGLPVAAIVLGAVICDTSRLALPGVWLERLGDASYSLYLSHGLFLSGLLQVWRRVLPQAELWNWLAFSLVAIIVASLASLLVYRFVERPLGAWVTRAFAPQPSPFARVSAAPISAGVGERKRAAI